MGPVTADKNCCRLSLYRNNNSAFNCLQKCLKPINKVCKEVDVFLLIVQVNLKTELELLCPLRFVQLCVT